MTDRKPAERADVCVIGAGPAGALVAYSLAKRGHDVVVLEAGPRFDFEKRREQMEMKLRPAHDPLEVWDMGGQRDAYTTSGEITYQLNRRRVKGVGGSTLHWGGRIERLHEKDFEMDTRYGLGADWPISYQDLQPYYADAEHELGVSGPGIGENPFAPPRDDDPPMDAFPPSYSDRLFDEACESLGITMHRVAHAKNSERYDGRGSCQSYGTCTPVCPSGAKYSADVHIRKAEEHGARVIDRVPVQRLEHDSAGDAIVAAKYVTPAGDTYRQEARQFVLACGGVETPRLLLLSKSEEYPRGLANSSGAVGKYFEERPVAVLRARLDQPTRQNLIGFGTSESHQFYEYEDGPPGSIKIEFGNTAGPTLPYLALHQDQMLGELQEVAGNPTAVSEWSDIAREAFTGAKWGDELLESMREQFGTHIEISAAIEDIPVAENRVTLDSSKTDAHGNPVPDVSWSPTEFAQRTMDYAFEKLDAIMGELDAEVTAKSQERYWRGIGHHLGTTRMGADPNESVVNARLRTHDLRNLSIVSSSVFVTGGAMQPTLTIAALALKAADHLHADL